MGQSLSDNVTRILLAALGGEGGGVLMNWVVSAARRAGHVVQATSVPGVAQRTGSTSYYIEVAPIDAPDTVLGLVPLAGRVDVLVSSELVETARVLAAGYVSPRHTTVVSSTARFFSTAEKIDMGDGRYSKESVRNAVDTMAQASFFLDLGKIAKDNGTFVSATMFGALAACGALPWSVQQSRDVLGDERSRAGFDAAASAIEVIKSGATEVSAPESAEVLAFAKLPSGLREVMHHGAERCEDYQDVAYRDLFISRSEALIAAIDLSDHRAIHAVTEAVRRLALWMAYEDVARVADLKTRPERFARIRDEVKLEQGQILRVTEYMKPRAEEIADILPATIGKRIMARAQNGGWFPLLGKGWFIRSNGLLGYRLLRLTAALKHIRRRSLRYQEEQSAIEEWLDALHFALDQDLDFAMGLGELPRVRKGYSDTLQRGLRAYDQIMAHIVRPACGAKGHAEVANRLRDAIGAALADDTHAKLDAVITGTVPEPELPMLKKVTNV